MGLAMNNVEWILRYSLSSPPAKVGMRLCSERELASILGEDRMKVRRALNKLAKQDILTRRHGSGTFVRKIVSFPHDENSPQIPQAKQLAKKIFASKSAGRTLPDRHKTFRLGLWGDLHCTTDVNSLILEGLTEKAEENGHRLGVHSLIKKEHVPLEAEDVARQLWESPSDGYIVVMRWAQLFEQAFAMVYGQTPPPVTYIFPDSCPTCRCQPLVELGTDAAVMQAVEIFAQQGYQRVGFLPMSTVVHDEQRDRKVYACALLQQDLDYQAIEFAPPSNDCIQAAMHKLLNRPQAPEALYIGDDHLLPGVAEYLARTGIVPGRDLAIITLANRGIPLANGHNWSRLEFNPRMAGRLAVESLVRVLRSAGEELCSFSHRPIWWPGDTHSKPEKSTKPAKTLSSRKFLTR